MNLFEFGVCITDSLRLTFNYPLKLCKLQNVYIFVYWRKAELNVNNTSRRNVWQTVEWILNFKLYAAACRRWKCTKPFVWRMVFGRPSKSLKTTYTVWVLASSPSLPAYHWSASISTASTISPVNVIPWKSHEKIRFDMVHGYIAVHYIIHRVRCGELDICYSGMYRTNYTGIWNLRNFGHSFSLALFCDRSDLRSVSSRTGNV